MKPVIIIAVLSVIAAPFSASADRGAPVPTDLLGQCDFTWDCDEDHQCMNGLLCADRHKSELKKKGYNQRTANCGPGAIYPQYEVCFDPIILINGTYRPTTPPKAKPTSSPKRPQTTKPTTLRKRTPIPTSKPTAKPNIRPTLQPVPKPSHSPTTQLPTSSPICNKRRRCFSYVVNGSYCEEYCA
jgi:hypothetical protein